MRVVVAGGHGQIAQQLQRRLAERGDEAVGIVRNPDHVADLEQLGAKAAVLDLENAGVQDVVGVIDGADAVVFAAGADRPSSVTSELAAYTCGCSTGSPR
jgi:uncharacterized protein YbjT (DUF2867 family)